MFYFYIIQSLKDKTLYYGSTNDLRRRFKEHNQGLSLSTKYKCPWRLVYYETFADQRDARSRERQIKKFGQGIYRLKSRIKYSIEQIQSM